MGLAHARQRRQFQFHLLRAALQLRQPVDVIFPLIGPIRIAFDSNVLLSHSVLFQASERRTST